jgi:hypothetical protein
MDPETAEERAIRLLREVLSMSFAFARTVDALDGIVVVLSEVIRPGAAVAWRDHRRRIGLDVGAMVMNDNPRAANTDDFRRVERALIDWVESELKISIPSRIGGVGG